MAESQETPQGDPSDFTVVEYPGPADHELPPFWKDPPRPRRPEPDDIEELKKIPPGEESVIVCLDEAEAPPEPPANNGKN
jgi:hypothetical protein